MKKRVTVRPGKAQGTFSVITGIVFVLIGLFVVTPSVGGFGLLWTLMAAGMTALNAWRAFGTGYMGPEIRIEDEESGELPLSPPPARPHDHIPSTALDAKRRLEQLESLKSAGLITGEEYQKKRSEILKEL